MALHEPHPHPGTLIVADGIDGSGKSTQLDLLRSWLVQESYEPYQAEWNAAKLIKSTMKLGRKERLFTPMSLCLLQCTDFADQLERVILPPLQAGMIVLADRYVYTAFTHDAVRGVDRRYLRNLYEFAPRPDLAFCFRMPVDTAVERVLRERGKLRYYDAGMDLGYSREPAENFRMFQARLRDAYEDVMQEFGLAPINAELPIEGQQRRMRTLVREVMARKGCLPGSKSGKDTA